MLKKEELYELISDKSMKHLTITLLTFLVLGGCGYSSKSECLVKELQECDSVSCELAARDYCNAEFPSKKKRYIYEEKSYPEDWVKVNVDSFNVYFVPQRPRYDYFKVCLDKAWRPGNGRCGEMWFIVDFDRYPNGMSWDTRDTDNDYFLKYVNESGDGLKENTVISVYEKKSVGFFAYHFDWIVDVFLFILGFIGFAIIVGFVASLFNSNDEDEEDESEEDLDEGHEYNDEEDEEVDIPEREQLESMTKAEIKEWADAFEFNVPSSLSKAEMIERFVEETDAYVESLEE